jgi:hypothetical protein
VTLATGSGTTALPVTSQASGMTAADFLKKVGLNGLKTYNLSGIKISAVLRIRIQTRIRRIRLFLGKIVGKQKLILLLFCIFLTIYL